MKIQDLKAYPASFMVPENKRVSLGIGTTVKRDAVLVKITTDSGIIGWGEAHAARAPTAIAELINTTLRQLVLGMSAIDTALVWQRIYKMQLASHGAGAAAAIGLSGIDMALWDIKGKVEQKPLYELLDGHREDIAAYAGGISLGYQPVEQLIEEISGMVEDGFTAVKLRIGDNIVNDKKRIEGIRAAFDSELVLLTDANTAYTIGDVRYMADVLRDNHVAWLEEPFPAHDYQKYRTAAAMLETPLAAGENHYTRFDFERVKDDGAITIWQPDLSKTGGITEALHISRMAAREGISIHPHTSVTGLNMAASLHFLSALPNAGYFEADLSNYNPFRTSICTADFSETTNGKFKPPTGWGLGVDIDESALTNYPVITGPGYV